MKPGGDLDRVGARRNAVQRTAKGEPPRCEMSEVRRADVVEEDVLRVVLSIVNCGQRRREDRVLARLHRPQRLPEWHHASAWPSPVDPAGACSQPTLARDRESVGWRMAQASGTPNRRHAYQVAERGSHPNVEVIPGRSPTPAPSSPPPPSRRHRLDNLELEVQGARDPAPAVVSRCEARPRPPRNPPHPRPHHRSRGRARPSSPRRIHSPTKAPHTSSPASSTTPSSAHSAASPPTSASSTSSPSRTRSSI